MKVSFVIPAYNEEKSIGPCLSSVFAEIKRVHALGIEVDTEVVVVDNASVDHTREEALKFSDVTVVHEPLKGLVYARRAGFVATSGDIVANIDADTLVPEGWLGAVVREFSEDQKLVALSGPYIFYDAPLYVRAMTRIFYFFGWLVYLFDRFILSKGGMLQGGNFVIRRDAWERAGGFDTSISFYGEDTDVARRISKQGKLKWIWTLPMHTSGRRLMHEGVVRTGVVYALNFFTTNLTGRPATARYTDVRR